MAQMGANDVVRSLALMISGDVFVVINRTLPLQVKNAMNASSIRGLKLLPGTFSEFDRNDLWGTELWYG